MGQSYIPKVNVAKELAEISKDFTHPRELIRETIANSIDASASRIAIEALKDDSSGEDELVIRIADDGVGMTREELEAFSTSASATSLTKLQSAIRDTAQRSPTTARW